MSETTARVRTGLDALSERDDRVMALLRGGKLGLVAHPASVDARYRHAVDVCRGAELDLRVLFGPEHGFGGAAQDMAEVGEETTSDGLEVVSLYGRTFDALWPRREILRSLDAIVIDLVDVGSRYYTYVWTAALVLRAAAAAGVRTVVLDRPNPLGGVMTEGAPQRPGYRSFVGLYDLPVRHGLTIGEIARMVQRFERLPEECLEVVPLVGWSREMTFGETGLPWVMPSPNMPTLETAWVYPGGCLFEGTNASEGRGTTRPFELIGAPYVDGVQLARQVRVEGAVLRPVVFEPTFHKHAGVPCGGVQIHVVDRARFRPYATYVRLLAGFVRQGRAAFEFRTEPYEFVSDRPAIDLLAGGAELRLALERGDDVDALLATESEGARAFEDERRSHFLYT